MGFPGGSDDKDSACSVRDLDLTLVWETATHSVFFLENPMDGGAWWATVHGPGESHGRRSLVGYSPWGVTKSQTQLDDFHFTKIYRVLPQQLKKKFTRH